MNGCDYCLSAHTYLGQHVAKLVALNTLTNYVNEVAKTEIDFPIVTHRAK